ncbi:hypothetical protein INN71_12890 [Nocardioides sp. ChNu-153]|uniref:hypothetical protein n=1 Tax=unclassified Nocardioides TaxID=2615069 RepID=UPI002404C45E|nr:MULTISPECIES: hypothetical protein [unclassified Nocardioides]MDF9715016.1 hypothetical protein [Nocardioides sp. ChNu-99]MDN7122285.1 hypothetical protein [Nocardioides sp. ChNu-153]
MALAMFLCASLGVLVAVEPRLALAVVLLLAGLLVRARTALVILLACVVSLGLVRRVTSGGRTETDPLLLLPIALLALALMWSVGRDRGVALRRTDPVLGLALAALVFLPLISWALSERSVEALYVAIVYSTCFLAMATAASGLLPNASEAVSRAAPWATLAIAGYGLVQFQFLPSWDRAWMVASNLSSIGAPVPGQVRVFGSLESPGPYALVLGALMCVVAQGVVRGAARRQLALRVTALAVAAPAFFLTGVRTGLLSMALVLLVAAVKTRSLALVTVAVGASAVLYAVGTRVIASSAETNVFTVERYTDLGGDQSLEARLRLLDGVGPALRQPLGTGFSASVQRADNLYIDLLVAAGPLALLAMLVVAAITAKRAVAADWKLPGNDLSLAVLFSMAFTVAGSTFATTSGLAVALAWGWVLSAPPARPDRDRGRASAQAVRRHPVTGAQP